MRGGAALISRGPERCGAGRWRSVADAPRIQDPFTRLWMSGKVLSSPPPSRNVATGCQMMRETDEVMVTCLGCGQPMRPRIGLPVCSSACRKREWRARRRARRRQVCANCGEAFVPARSDARFCGAACRQCAYRARKAASSAVGGKFAGLLGPTTAALEPAPRTERVKIDPRALIG